MPTKVVMPQLGESVVEGTVSRWMKREGETVEEFESLLEVNTDKVDSEIPSPAGGTLLQILVPEGQTVRAGTLLAWIGDPGEALPGGGPAPAAADEAESAPDAQPAGAAAPARAVSAGRDEQLGFVSPIVARLAQEHQLDLRQVRGTGQGGRITKKDVLAYLETAGQPAAPAGAAAEETRAPWETPGEGDLFRPTEMVFQKPPGEKPPAQPAPAGRPQPEPPAAPPVPAPPPAAAGSAQRLVPHSAMRKRIAEHMLHSVRTSPHVTTVMEADLSAVQKHLNANRARFEQDGLRLTYTAYFAAAAVRALQAHPLVNSSWSDEGIILHGQVNLGMAVSLGSEGLIVPVIRNAGDLSLSGLARAIQDLAGRAREGRLQPEEVRDGTFTITNHGITGSLFATPIINQPQCGILGVGAIQKRVVVTDGDAIAVRPMVYLSLTFDHRILDGASADGFLAAVVRRLESDP